MRHPRPYISRIPMLASILLASHLFLIATSTQAQVLDGSFDPNANGTINAVVVQPDGKILIGGDFTMVRGFTRQRVARLNTDGTLDFSFVDPQIYDGEVDTLALQADGHIVVGGSFTKIQYDPLMMLVDRQRLLRLNPDATLDASFIDPRILDGQVLTAIIQPDGKIVVGGSFIHAINPTDSSVATRNRVARFDVDGKLDLTFNDPLLNDTVRALALQVGGAFAGGIMAGGDFYCIIRGGCGGIYDGYLAGLESYGSLLPGFPTRPNGSVYAIAQAENTHTFVGGNFTSAQDYDFSGLKRQRLAVVRFENTTPSIYDTFHDPQIVDGSVHALALHADSAGAIVFAAGDFTHVNHPGAGLVTRQRVAEFAPDGTVNLAFGDVQITDGVVNAIALQGANNLIVVGSFTRAGIGPGMTTTRNRIARFTNIALDRIFKGDFESP
jgi:uncharacterized delta-60 repeat protein